VLFDGSAEAVGCVSFLSHPSNTTGIVARFFEPVYLADKDVCPPDFGLDYTITSDLLTDLAISIVYDCLKIFYCPVEYPI
jgi:hypothetical protein